MSGCSAVGCSNRGDRGFFMKSFPRDPERRALWASQMKRDNWQPNNNSRLCEIHFDADQWEKTRQDGTRKLKCNAIPSLFEFGEQTLKRKVKKQKFIIPLNSPEEESNLVSIFGNRSTNPERKKRNRLRMDLGIGCATEIERERLIFETDSKSLNNSSQTTSHYLLFNNSNESATPKIERLHISLPKTSVIPTVPQISSNGIAKPADMCCRLCTNISNPENYIPIFGESDLAEKISRCLPIIVLPTDELSLYICQQCLYNLNISYKLIIGSIKADLFLRTEFERNNETLESEEPIIKINESIEDTPTDKDEPVFNINGPLKCDLCDVLFRDMNLFDEHIETVHLLKWRCSLCDHSFQTSQELLAHKRFNHSGQISTCFNCENDDLAKESCSGVSESVQRVENRDDESSENNLNDQKVMDKLPDLNCAKCKIIFDDAEQFCKHHTMHLPRRLKCTTCSKRCQSIFDYINHMRIFHNQTRRDTNLGNRRFLHDCKYCKKVFLVKQQLVIHLRKHKKEMLDDPSVITYTCVTCSKIFVDRALYQKHRNVHDPACWHKFRCYICDRPFMDKFKLKIHQSIHNGVKPYQCDVCGRTFNRNANMTRHRVKHFEQNCRHCEKIFRNAKSLREHMKDIHGNAVAPRKNNSRGTGDDKEDGSKNYDRFICGYCGKQLNSYYSLLDHERIHTGDKPYVCKQCGKAFRSITARWDHMVRHEKGNYVCELCGKIMSNKLNLRSHLRKHAAIDQKRFECNECGKLFQLKWKLNAHLLRIHRSASS